MRAAVQREVEIVSSFIEDRSSRTDVLEDVFQGNLLVWLSDCTYVCGCLSLNKKYQVIFFLQLH